jgi:hypothetical protein
LRSEE